MCFVANDSIVNDSEALEDDETFRLNITTLDPNDPRIRVTEPMTTVIIVDSDGERLNYNYHCKERRVEPPDKGDFWDYVSLSLSRRLIYTQKNPCDSFESRTVV